VAPGAGDGDRIQKLEEVEIKRRENSRWGPLLGREVRPCVEGRLRPAEDQIDVPLGLELRFEIFRLAFVSKSELVLQVIEAIVDRGCREHQHFRAHALAHDPVHRTLIPRLPIFECVIVAKVVRLVDDDQIVVAPVDLTQPHAERFTTITKQIGVAKDVVAEAVPYQRVVLQVSFVCRPIVGELLRAKDQYGSIAQFVVLDDREGCERLSESDAVGQDATVVGL